MAETKATKKYFEGLGRRKEAVARVRITPASKTSYIINDRPIAEYFTVSNMAKNAESAINNSEVAEKFAVSVKVSGGGIASQAESVRLGVARALLKYNIELRPVLKKLGYLKRDARVVERKKFGLKKSRKRPAWSKR